MRIFPSVGRDVVMAILAVVLVNTYAGPVAAQMPERPEEMHHGPVPTARLRALTN